MLAVMERRRRRPRSFGQTMTEFALVVPVLFILVLGVLDGGLLMFSVGTARYAADGTPLLSPEPWQPATRNVGNGTSDFLGITVKFTYGWKSGLFKALGPVQSTATYYIRLEPQSY